MMTQDETREMTKWFESHNYIHSLKNWEDDPNCTCYYCLKKNKDDDNDPDRIGSPANG